jgi:hypothetical protein
MEHYLYLISNAKKIKDQEWTIAYMTKKPNEDWSDSSLMVTASKCFGGR